MLKYRYQQGRQANRFVLPCLCYNYIVLGGILWQGLQEKEAAREHIMWCFEVLTVNVNQKVYHATLN